jgi:hypothetical protein
MATAAPKRVSTGEARRRLAEKKDAAPAYKRPRGNQELDQRAMEHERRRLEAILA